MLAYGKDKKLKNRQYHNELLIKCIEQKALNSKNKIMYTELINFLNNTVENELINFYNENEIIKNDPKCLFFDEHYKSETNNSLIEKLGFLKILKCNVNIIISYLLLFKNLINIFYLIYN